MKLICAWSADPLYYAAISFPWANAGHVERMGLFGISAEIIGYVGSKGPSL